MVRSESLRTRWAPPAQIDQCSAGEVQGRDLLVEQPRRHQDDQGDAGSSEDRVRDCKPEFAKRGREQEDVYRAERQATGKQASPRQIVRLGGYGFEDDVGAHIECDGQGQERIPHASRPYALVVA